MSDLEGGLSAREHAESSREALRKTIALIELMSDVMLQAVALAIVDALLAVEARL